FIFGALLNLVIDHGLVAEYLRESSDILTGPAQVHLSIFTELRRHQVVRRNYSCNLKSVWVQLQVNVSRHVVLGACQERFYVAHNGIEVLALMQPVAVELGELVLPAQLPFCEDMFLKRVVCLEYDHRGGGLKTDAPLDTDNGVPNVNVPPDGIGPRDLLEALD